MKKIFSTLFILVLVTVSYAQEGVGLDALNSSIDKSKAGQILDMLTFSASAGSGSINNNQFSNVALGELNISYRLNNISVGVSTMGNLSGCTTGYTNAEGEFVSMDDEDVDMDDDGEDSDDGENDDCDADEISNVMATVSYKLSDKVPVFVQFAGGYSFDSSAPAISVFVGYNQELFSRLGIVGGFRASNVFIAKPIDAVNFSSYNFRAELGLSWNF